MYPDEMTKIHTIRNQITKVVHTECVFQSYPSILTAGYIRVLSGYVRIHQDSMLMIPSGYVDTLGYCRIHQDISGYTRILKDTTGYYPGYYRILQEKD